MTTAAITHFVFVDFENIQEVQLALVQNKPVYITLLIGKNQGKLDYALVEQIHRYAAQVELVKLDASGRNALDLTLAYYLGQAVQRTPGAQFSIVSKDKDFEPMIGHLVGKGIKVVRCDSFAALPFLPKPRKSHPVKGAIPVKSSIPVKVVPLFKVGGADGRLDKLKNRLINNLGQRPKKRDRLLAYINTAFGGKLSEEEQNTKLDELTKHEILFIDVEGKVTYAPAK